MNEPAFILIRDLVVLDRLPDKEPTEPADVRLLAADIKKYGLIDPILIDADSNNIIDGLRRVRALQALGQDNIMAIRSGAFEDTCEYLSNQALAAGTPPYWRVYELFVTTNQQQKDRGARMRRRRTQKLPPSPRARELFCSSLQLGHEGMITAVTSVYRSFYFPDEDEVRSDAYKAELVEIQRQLENEDITLYEAKGMISRLDIPQGMVGDIVNKEAQRSALTTSLSQLAGFTKGVSRLGPLSPDFEKFELELLLRGFEEERRHLLRFIKNLKERITEQ